MKRIVIITALSILFTGCASTRDYTVNGQDFSDGQDTGRKALAVIGAGVAIYGLSKMGQAINGKPCYTGPQGGTYTITSGGNKNYAGC